MLEKTEALGSEPVGKLLFKLALPSFFGLMVGALYSLVDAIFIGQALGTIALGAVAITGPILAIITAIGDMIGAGSASLLSRSLGAKEYEKSRHTIGTTFSSVIISSVVISILGMFLLEPMMKFFGATETIIPYAMEYTRVIIIFNIVIGFVSAINNLIAAEGNVNVATKGVIIGLLINLGLDPLFLFVFKMGMGGPALATIIAYSFTTIYFVRYIFKSGSILKIKLKYLKIKMAVLLEIIKIGISSFIRQISSSVVAIVINNLLRIHGGDLSIAVYGSLGQIMMFLFLPAFSVVEGMLPIVGYNYGAGKYLRVNKAVKVSLISSVLISLVGYSIGMIFPEFLLSFFSKDIKFIESGVNAIRISLCVIPLVAFQIIGAGIFQSIGKAKEAIIIALSNDILFLIPVSIILSKFFGLVGIWMSFAITDVMASILAGILLRKQMRKMYSANDDNEVKEIA